ncbi:MAG TPA: hypothetical protein VKC54_02825 [Patescibacteria group bacterium]|nr:hypothetical protein [Patescibacteria group bacterium]
MTDIRQSVYYANYLKREGWIVERIEKINYFIKKLSFVGSILKVQRPEKINFDTIDKLARKYRVFQIIIEPKDEVQTELLASDGFKLSKNPFLPSKTLQINLTQSEKTIFNHFKKDTRRVITRGEAQNIKVYNSPNEIKIWRKAWKNSVKFDRYVPSLKQLINLRKSFPQNKSLFLASHNIFSRIIGGALFTVSSHERSNYISYYWYGFTNNEGRSTLSQVPLLYQGILWAKRQGCKVFDFEGIYDARFPNKSWLGFTHFKKSFGGNEVLYPGSYTKLRLPV